MYPTNPTTITTQIVMNAQAGSQLGRNAKNTLPLMKEIDTPWLLTVMTLQFPLQLTMLYTLVELEQVQQLLVGVEVTSSMVMVVSSDRVQVPSSLHPHVHSGVVTRTLVDCDPSE